MANNVASLNSIAVGGTSAGGTVIKTVGQIWPSKKG